MGRSAVPWDLWVRAAPPVRRDPRLEKSNSGTLSSTRRLPLATSIITSSLWDSPAGFHCHQPVTSDVPSGVSSKACPSSARPGSGSGHAARRTPPLSPGTAAPPGSALLRPHPLSGRPTRPRDSSVSTAKSLSWSGPRSWSQNLTGADSCKMAVTPASFRSWRRRASSAALFPRRPAAPARRRRWLRGRPPPPRPRRRRAGPRPPWPRLRRTGAARASSRPRRAFRPRLARAGIRPLGGEKQRGVRQETRAALPLRQPG